MFDFRSVYSLIARFTLPLDTLTLQSPAELSDGGTVTDPLDACASKFFAVSRVPFTPPLET